jgi:hypothetical protein
MNLAGIATLVVGLVAYAGIWSAATGTSGGGITGLGLLLVIVITFALMAIHEAIHGIVFSRFGGTPQYGATMVGKVLPAFYCTSPGMRFTKAQYILIALAPAMVLVPATVLGVALLPHGGWLVVPAAMHLGGCIGDFAMTYIVARIAPGSLVEDLKSGMRFYLPAGSAVAAAT